MKNLDLLQEWLALPSPGAGDLRILESLGVGRDAAYRTGGLAVARINAGGRLWAPEPAGTPAFVLPTWDGPAPSIYQAVESPRLIDLIAWRPDDPTQWWCRLGDVDVVLGADLLDLAHTAGRPISLHQTPLQWLQADCRGACMLNYCEAAWGRMAA